MNKIPKKTNIYFPGMYNWQLYTVFALLIMFFIPTLWGLCKVWYNNEDYSHGFFVIPIVIFMIWQKKDRLISTEIKPSWIGLPFFIISAFLYIIAYISKFYTLNYLAMMMLIVSTLIFLFGWRFIRILLLPVLFLLFMFPIPSAYYIMITNPLKLLITDISANLIYLMGIPVYQDGNLIFLAKTQLEVAEACSGVRSLYSYLMLGFLFALMSDKKRNKIILIASTVPLAIMVNCIRVTGTGILSHFWGSQVAQGFFHEFSGIVLFIIGFLILFLEFYLLTPKRLK